MYNIWVKNEGLWCKHGCNKYNKNITISLVWLELFSCLNFFFHLAFFKSVYCVSFHVQLRHIALLLWFHADIFLFLLSSLSCLAFCHPFPFFLFFLSPTKSQLTFRLNWELVFCSCSLGGLAICLSVRLSFGLDHLVCVIVRVCVFIHLCFCTPG